MKCNSCGAIIDESLDTCPHCNAKVGNADYVLLTEDDRVDNLYTNYPENNRKKIIISLIITAVIIIVAGCSIFFITKSVAPSNPKMTFSTGYGIINGDEPVIYLQFGKNVQLEYIHGARLYAYDKSDEESTVGEVLTTDYEYTKNVDGTFRALFFDASDFGTANDTEYTYTVEVDLGFANYPNHIFTYNQAVTFPGEITGEASEQVFDHSMDKEQTTQAVEETQKTTVAETTTMGDISYIYEGFWYDTPIHEADSYSINAIKFSKNNKCVITSYYKVGTKPWKITDTNGTYEIKNGKIVVTDQQGKAESYEVKSAEKLIDGLTSRKYNSTKNAEDFFNI